MGNTDDCLSSLSVRKLLFRFLRSKFPMLVVFYGFISSLVFAQVAQLRVISPISQDIAVLLKDEPQAKTLKISYVTSENLKLESVIFRP